MKALHKVLIILAVIYFVISIITHGCYAKSRRFGRNKGKTVKTKEETDNHEDQDRFEINIRQSGGDDTRTLSQDLNANNNRKLNANRRNSDRLYNAHQHQQHRHTEGEKRKENKPRGLQMSDNKFTTENVTTIKPKIDYDRKRYREMIKQQRLMSIREEILQKLNLTRVPNITKNEYTDYIRNNTKWIISNNNKPLFGEERKVTQSFQPSSLTPSCNTPHRSDKSWNDKDKFRLYFDINRNDFQADKTSKVYSVTLRLYKQPLEDCNCNKDHEAHRNSRTKYKQRHKHNQANDEEDNTLRITVYQYLRPLRAGKNTKKKQVATTIVTKHYQGSIRLDLKNTFLSWLDKPKKNFGLSVVTEDSDGNLINPNDIYTRQNCSNLSRSSFLVLPMPLTVLDHPHNASQLAGYNSALPSLDIITSIALSREAPSHTRQKRYSGKRNLTWKKPVCNVVETYITFEELKWTDWIIQPRGFKYTTCKGTCSRLPRERYFKRKVAPSGKNNFKPIDHECCGPTKLKPLQIIHFNEKQAIMLSIFEDFIISECGCRP